MAGGCPISNSKSLGLVGCSFKHAKLIGSRKYMAVREVPKISPTQLDPLLAKDKITTGGDCGRIRWASHWLTGPQFAHSTGLLGKIRCDNTRRIGLGISFGIIILFAGVFQFPLFSDRDPTATRSPYFVWTQSDAKLPAIRPHPIIPHLIFFAIGNISASIRMM